jgi:hypothetical protein
MARPFDKIFAILCLAVFAAVAISAQPEEPRLAAVVQLARQVKAETERAHPKLHPAPLPEFARPWDQVVTDFRVNDWAVSYDTELVPRVKIVKPPPVYDVYPKIFEVKLESDMDKVTVRASAVEIPKKPSTPFASVHLERREGAEWRIVKTFDAAQSSFEFTDTSVAPRKAYAYRFVGVPQTPKDGKLIGDKVTTLEQTVQMPDIWKIKVKFIFRDPNSKVLTAFLDLEKYSGGRWFKKSQCKVPFEAGYRIGGAYTVGSGGEIRWDFIEKGVSYETGLTLKSMDEAKQQIIVVDSEKQERVIGR